jgi:hypothetical protein
MERYHKANTVKRRTYSLFRQGCMYYQAIPNMPGLPKDKGRQAAGLLPAFFTYAEAPACRAHAVA